MPSLKSIRKRIGSVKNTQKITRAMKLVAAAKLRRAQDAIVAARPFARSLEQVVAELAQKAGSDSHPLLAARPGNHATVLMITSDRGLAGAFNSSIIRAVERYAKNELASYEEVVLHCVGRKGHGHFKRRKANLADHHAAPTLATALDLSRDLAHTVIDAFEAGETDRVFLVYNEFKSAISQTVIVKQLLPVDPDLVAVAAGLADDEAGESDESGETSGAAGDFLYEPSLEALLEHIMPLYVQNGIFRASLESIASEFGARMSAMENATRNAGEMIEKLTLQYNRARQAAITKELMEIIGGAEALKG